MLIINSFYFIRKKAEEVIYYAIIYNMNRKMNEWKNKILYKFFFYQIKEKEKKLDFLLNNTYKKKNICLVSFF